ncbi:hypothetical protein BX264_4989 [Streptomyces sp. 2333.5]|nr:hypothetical protein BX264_4989 [Streptomyces sp. 2333.5]
MPAFISDLRAASFSVLLAHPTTDILAPMPPQEEPSAAAVLGSLDDEDDELTRRFRHVRRS